MRQQRRRQITIVLILLLVLVLLSGDTAPEKAAQTPRARDRAPYPQCL